MRHNTDSRITPDMLPHMNSSRWQYAIVLVSAAVVASRIFAATSTRVVPVFADHVPGALGSTWISELRFYNSSDTAQTVTMARLMPLGDSRCTGFDPITIPAHASRFTRSIGCAPNGAGAIEIAADSTVAVSTVVTNVAGTDQNRCFPAGFTEPITVVSADATYALTHTLTHLMSVPHGEFKPGRHNLGVVNPNPSAIDIELRYFDEDGTEMIQPPVGWLKTITVAASSLTQVNDFLPGLPVIIDYPLWCAYWRVEAKASAPFYMYDSYADSATNDATFSSGN